MTLWYLLVSCRVDGEDGKGTGTARGRLHALVGGWFVSCGDDDLQAITDEEVSNRTDEAQWAFLGLVWGDSG